MRARENPQSLACFEFSHATLPLVHPRGSFYPSSSQGGSMQPRIIDGKYEILRELSKGGMGAVYEARHVLTRRRVALKLILAETLARPKPANALRRFEREARAAGSIESRHVVSVLDTGIDDATSDNYIVMELLSGEDLRQLLRRAGKLSVDLVLAIASQICSGLRRAHEQGIVHRDIKAGNVFLARRDDGLVEVKILDFGIAKLRVDPLASTDGHDLTRSGSVLGSPLYMSPEQATGSRELDARSDIWSLGIVMYEALTGVTPHGNQALGAVILAICSTPAAPVRERAPWVPPEVAALVHRALALEPGQRFASAEEMQAAIERLLPGGPAIHERMLESVPTGSENQSDTPQAGSDGSPAPPAQTTVDAVTYGSGGSKSKPGTLRRRKLVGAAAGGAIALTAVIGLILDRADMSVSGAAGSASATVAALAEKPVASSAVPTAPAAKPASSLPSEGVAAPPRASGATAEPAGSKKPPLIRQRALRSPPAATPPSAPPVQVPTAPSAAGNEPAIDRRFD
jgi:eukaryotic-like serine/threonine-protein kinase